MSATLELDGERIELAEDACGLVGRAVIDGVPVTIHATITSSGTRSVSPAKWCAARPRATQTSRSTLRDCATVVTGRSAGRKTGQIDTDLGKCDFVPRDRLRFTWGNAICPMGHLHGSKLYAQVRLCCPGLPFYCFFNAHQFVPGQPSINKLT